MRTLQPSALSRSYTPCQAEPSTNPPMNEENVPAVTHDPFTFQGWVSIELGRCLRVDQPAFLRIPSDASFSASTPRRQHTRGEV